MKQFKKVYVEITNICNLQCEFCPPNRRKPEFMSAETFEKILKQIKPHTKYIYLHVKGEPLLHPTLDQLLDLCYAEGFFVNITTNGTLIHKVREMLLTKPAIRQINFSMHSIEQYRMGHSLGGEDGVHDREEVVRHILNFTKEAIARTKMYLSLRLWNFQEGMEKLSSDRKNHVVLEAIEKAFHLDYKIKEVVGPDKGIKIADRVYVNQAFQFQWPDLNIVEETATGFCYGLRSQAAILVDGTVVPCCLDGEGIIRLGNIHETDFSVIVEGVRAKNILEGFSSNRVVEELCRKCGYMKRFKIPESGCE